MTWGRLVQRFHTALTRPFRRPDIDYAARERIERRQLDIERQLDRLMELRAQANTEGRKPWEANGGRSAWDG